MSWTWGLTNLWGAPNTSSNEQQNQLDADDDQNLSSIQNVLGPSHHQPNPEDDQDQPQSGQTDRNSLTADNFQHTDDTHHYLDGVLSPQMTNQHQHVNKEVIDPQDHPNQNRQTNGNTSGSQQMDHTTHYNNNGGGDDDSFLAGFSIAHDDENSHQRYGNNGDDSESDDDDYQPHYTKRSAANAVLDNSTPKRSIGVLKSSRIRSLLGKDDDLVGNKLNSEFKYKEIQTNQASRRIKDVSDPLHGSHGGVRTAERRQRPSIKSTSSSKASLPQRYHKSQREFEKRYHDKQYNLNWEVEQEDEILADMASSLERLYQGSQRTQQQLAEQHELLNTTDHEMTFIESHFNHLETKMTRLIESTGMRKLYIILIECLVVVVLAILIFYT